MSSLFSPVKRLSGSCYTIRISRDKDDPWIKACDEPPGYLSVGERGAELVDIILTAYAKALSVRFPSQDKLSYTTSKWR